MQDAPQGIGSASVTQSAHASSLPLQLTRFIGRSQERREVRRLLTDARLVTLTGPGGVGKTRLALEVAADLLAPSPRSGQARPGGVCLVELAPLADPTLVPRAVASALKVNEVPGEPLLATLVGALASRELLVVLDNCEHLASACAELADRLLRACPGLTILATSREPLRVPGEIVWQVPPLSVPDPRVDLSLAEISDAESVSLFVDRAKLALPAFVLGANNATTVAEICRRLDGIPLAIELAAARANILGPTQLLGRLDDRFRLLTGGSRTSPTRQQTLRAALEWSYRLLIDAERTLLQRLAVFAGGATLEAVEAVCSGGGIEPREVLELLGRLVDKSLVVADTRSDDARYRLLETLRQHGWERLIESGADAAIRRRHAEYMVALAERAEPELEGPTQATRSNRLERELGNIRAALAWCREHDAQAGLRLAASLERFWHVRGYLTEARGWLEDLAGRADGETIVCAKALHVAGELALRQGEYGAARSLLEQSLAMSRRLGDEHGSVLSLERLGRLAMLEREYERARELVEQSLTALRSSGDRWNVAWALSDLALIAMAQGDPDRARAPCEESLAIFRALGDTQGIGYSLSNSGQVARLRGEHDRARELLDEALRLFREVGDSPFIGRALCSLGTVDLVQGNLERADTTLREALNVLREVRSRFLGVCLCLMGILAIRAGKHARGARLVGAAFADEHSSPSLHPDEGRLLETGLAAARAALGEEALARARTDGSQMTPEQAVAFALEVEAPAPAVRPDGERSGSAHEARSPVAALSAREREVAMLIARGLSNRAIAERLVIAERTVESHVTHVLDKLRLRSRAQIAVWAVNQGLLTNQPD